MFKISKLPTITPILHVQGLYSIEEQELIWEELKFLAKKDKLLPPERTGAAIDADGNIKKSSRGIFLDSCYGYRELSNILQINRKIFSKEFVAEAVKESPIFNYITTSTSDHTLLSYYESSNYYLPHFDSATLTAITYIWKTPRQFSGGELIFHDDNYKVDVECFDTIIFPSFMVHEVTPVKLNNGVPEWQYNGRFAISQFIAHV